MNWFRLAQKSLQNRKLTTLLTVFSMSLSLILLMSVERIKRAAEDGFTQSVSGVDLLVGARTGSLQLVLYSVFNMGQATQNVSIESYEEIKNRPEVAWTIPYSLGDGHKGFRVISTNSDFFEHYRYRSKENIKFSEGKMFSGLLDVVIGADVARELKYKIGDKVIVAHGSSTGDSIQGHDDKPFVVSGILTQTGTAIDRALYISLEAMEAIHLDWQTGSAPSKNNIIALENITPNMLKPKNITSFFIRTKNRIETLRLQREINQYEQEALLAVIPGAVLADLWQSLGVIENVLKAISFLVMLVGLVSMFIAIMTSLNERRREMAILRALGAGLKNILGLIIAETFILSLMAVLFSCLVKVAVEFLLKDWLQIKYGLYLQDPILGKFELMYMGLMVVLSVVISIIPAIKAMNSALKDGLSVKL